MSKIFFITFIIFDLLCFSGCSRNEPQTDNNNSSATVGNAASTAGSQLPDANKNQNDPSRQSLDPESLDRAKKERLANSNQSEGKSDLKSVGGGQAETIGRPAPDDSVITTSMDQKSKGFIETRTFKSHPLLAKVEFVTYDAEHKEGRVYLRNGKIIKLPPDKKFNLITAAPQEFLDAAGVQPPPAPKNDAAKKKPDN